MTGRLPRRLPRRLTRRLPRLGAAAAAVAGLVAACSSGGASAPTTALPSTLRAAPEPAVAPSPTSAPAGRVAALPVREPEGFVVDPVSGLGVVAGRQPRTLALVDPVTLRTLRVLPVPGAARHLQLAAQPGAVLVPGEDTDLLATVAVPSGGVLDQVKVGRQPHDAVAVGGVVVDADELGGSVTATRGDTRLRTVPGSAQPGGVTASAGLAAVVDVRGRLLDVYRPDPLVLVGQVPVGAGPTHAVDLGGGYVAVADTSGGAVLVVRLTGAPAVVQSLPLPGRPYGMAVDPLRRRLFVTTTADDTLHELAVSGVPRLTATGRTWPTVQQPNSAAVVPATGRVLVAGATREGQVQAVDP